MLKLTVNPENTQIARLDTGVEFLGHIFDGDGCYQPVAPSRSTVLPNQVQQVLKNGAAQVVRSGQHVTQQGKNIATRLGKRLKQRT